MRVNLTKSLEALLSRKLGCIQLFWLYEYEYRCTEYEYDEDRNALMPEQRIAIYPPVGRGGIDRLLNFVAVRIRSTACEG